MKMIFFVLLQIKAVSCSLCTAFYRNWDFLRSKDAMTVGGVVLKLNLLFFSLYRDLFLSLTLSNVGKPSRSWIPRAILKVRKRNKISLLLVHVLCEIGRWDAKNNPREYGIAWNFGSGLRDWRTLSGILVVVVQETEKKCMKKRGT